MSDEDALLSAIAAAPDEDTPRLAFADWLDEHDRPIRAEFIRTQIEIARKDHLPRAVLNRYVDLFKRNQELLDNHRSELLGPLAVLPAWTVREFRRGFAAHVSLTVGDFLDHSELLDAATPLPKVTVTRVATRLDEFVLCPDLGCVTRVELYSAALDNGTLPWPDVEDMLDAGDRLTRLEALDLSGCGVGDLHLDQPYNFTLPKLIELDLSNNTITDLGVQRLLSSDWPQTLRQLILGGNPISDDGAEALAAGWPTGDADVLEHLNMRFTNIGPRGQQALLTRFGGRIDLF